jgi:Mn-dependent DtxR family transcriptional regulator
VRGLKLDEAQQAEVRRALQAQREAMHRLMRAPADPAVPRVAAIHAIADRTAERIRAVLNDEQKKLYGQPLPQGFAAGEGKPGVEEWLNALRQKGN